MKSGDPYDLNRFVEAQRDIYEMACAEIRRGQKESHWMWFIFPQIAGLGSSAMAQRYAIRNRAEAAAYLGHPLLGARLLSCVDDLLQVERRTAQEIFGSPDDLKLRSCATLFVKVAPDGSVFHQLLAKFFAGEPDARTVALLDRHGAA